MNFKLLGLTLHLKPYLSDIRSFEAELESNPKYFETNALKSKLAQCSNQDFTCVI